MDDLENFGPQAPPSYALESSSGESEWDEDASPRPKETKPLAPDAVVELQGSVEKGGEAVFFVGEAGERLAKGVNVDDASLVKVLVDGEQFGSIAAATATTPTFVFLSPSLPLASLHPLASTLLATLAPTSTHILASYHLPSYVISPRPASPPLLYLRSQATPSLTSLSAAGVITPYSPPNLLHGLPSLLLTLSALSTVPSTLVLLPTTAPPASLNGPFAVSSIVTNTFYDAGGPTSLSDPGGLYREISGKVQSLANELGWDWWVARDGSGKGFDWLDKQRTIKRKENVSSMYM